jgi:RHS repeat-associated protein
MRRGAGDYFHHADSLGSVMAVTNAAGAVVTRYEYQDFGEPSFSGSSIGNPYLFAGARYDSFGLYHLRTRHLDPRAGRFITRDTVGIWEDLASLGNGATYAANNPQTKVDPLGTRTRACAGPWEGFRTVEFEFDDCGGSRQVAIETTVCDAFASVNQAYADAKRLVQFYQGDLPDVDWGDLATEIRIDRWFGSSDRETSFNTKKRVRDVLRGINHAFKTETLGFECEDGGCDGANAYVYGFWSDIHFCDNYFDFGLRRRTAILLHEMSHYWGDTDDHFYYRLPADPGARDESDVTLRDNADTYEEFLFEFYIP